MEDNAPEDISFGDNVFDIDFHPHSNVVAAGLISGVVELYNYSKSANSLALQLTHHTSACRGVMFSEDGQVLYTASADCSIRAVDPKGGLNWAEINAHNAAVNSLCPITSDVFASGDDEGCIKLWDTRQHRCLAEWKENTDFISDMTCNPANDHLVSTSGDGRLSVFDLRKNILAGQSDELDDELLSVKIIKNGKKIVCGSQDGVIVIFSWGTWGDMSDRFPGHPESVESLLKIDEDTICTGSSDGIIRIVQIHPNKLLGLVGDHEDFPVEVLKYSHDRKLIGSVSHVNKVHFWDVEYLMDDDDNEMDDDEVGNNDKDSSDEDMAMDEGGRKAFPTANESFFADL